MKYFSVPSDFKKETIESLCRLNGQYGDSQVIETYGQISIGNVINSGRAASVIPEVSFEGLKEYIAYSKERGIEFSYTLNPSCFGNFEFTESGAAEILKLVERLYRIGVKSLTLASPSMFELVKQSGYKLEIKASAICEIASSGRALFYKQLGAERVVLDADITRNFRNIRNICSTIGGGAEIIVNNVCYKNCAYKMFHYSHDAHSVGKSADNNLIQDYYTNRCSMQKAGAIRNIIKLNWIRPEDLNYYYKSGIQYFKIQGRQNVLKGNLIKALECYMKEDFDGNLFDLITLFAPYNSFQPYIDNKKLDGFVKRFYDVPDFCRDMCSVCNYCEEYAKKSMNKNAEALNKQALEFYKGYDRYSNFASSIQLENAPSQLKKAFKADSLNAEFEFEKEK